MQTKTLQQTKTFQALFLYPRGRAQILANPRIPKDFTNTKHTHHLRVFRKYMYSHSTYQYSSLHLSNSSKQHFLQCSVKQIPFCLRQICRSLHVMQHSLGIKGCVPKIISVGRIRRFLVGLSHWFRSLVTDLANLCSSVTGTVFDANP